MSDDQKGSAPQHIDDTVLDAVQGAGGTFNPTLPGADDGTDRPPSPRPGLPANPMTAGMIRHDQAEREHQALTRCVA